MGREAFRSTPAMATTTAITIATGVMANARNYGPLVCTRRSWANKVGETANDIAKCAGEDSFAIPLLTGRFMHGVGTVGGGQHVTFTRAGVIGSSPSAADSAKPTAVA